MVDSSRQADDEIEITKEMIAAGVKVLVECGPLEGVSDRSPLHAAVVREILEEAWVLLQFLKKIINLLRKENKTCSGGN